MTTGISWTDETWPVLAGCSWTSPGCDGCYAARDAAGRLQNLPAYKGLTIRSEVNGLARFTGEVRLREDKLNVPLHWSRPRRVFVASQSDLFHPEVPDSYVDQVLATVLLADRHQFQVLTKRPKRMAEYMRKPDTPERIYQAAVRRVMGMGRGHGQFRINDPVAQWPLPNLWLGTSVESGDYLFRTSYLGQCAGHAAGLFVSVEPLVSITRGSFGTRITRAEVDDRFSSARIGWVIVGGESGPKARPMHPDWARLFRGAAYDTGALFHFKQWGRWHPMGAHVEGEDPAATTGLQGLAAKRFLLMAMEGNTRGVGAGSLSNLLGGWSNGVPDTIMVDLPAERRPEHDLLDGVLHDQVPPFHYETVGLGL